MITVWVYYVAVALGGACGAFARFVIDVYVTQLVVSRSSGANFPYGTLVANVAGCALAGVVLSIDPFDEAVAAMQVLLVAGVGGGLTTFSSFAYQVAELINDGDRGVTLRYVGATITLGIAAFGVCYGIALVVAGALG